MTKLDRSRVIPLAEAQAGIAIGERSVHVAAWDARCRIRAACSCEGRAAAQGEIYVIVRGFFVGAGTKNQFEDVTEEPPLWRVFYGPHGGDRSGIERRTAVER